MAVRYSFPSPPSLNPLFLPAHPSSFHILVEHDLHVPFVIHMVRVVVTDKVRFEQRFVGGDGLVTK